MAREGQAREQLAVITGRSAGAALRAVVDAADGRLVSWRPSQVEHRGGRVTAAYQAWVCWGHGGRPSEEMFGATVGEDMPSGVTVVTDGRTSIGVWRVPHDPDLPGLATAMDPDAVGRLWERFGVPGGRARVWLRSYRPRRRAVVEASAAGGRLFLKVVRPHRARELHERHRLLAEAGLPSPASLGWTDDGVVVLASLPGIPLRQALRSSDGPWPAPRELTRLLDRLPDTLLAGPGRPSWSDRADHYADQIATSMPELGPRVRAIADELERRLEAGPRTPVHGDLYEHQILVDNGRVSGVLDLDTAGPGDRADDLACVIGHLDVLAQVWPDRARVITTLRGDYLSHFDRHVDKRQLRLRAAGVVLSLATGPHRVQELGWRQATERRVALAEAWVARARTA